MALSKKKEHFAQLVAKGETQSDAYRLSHPDSEAADATIHEAASRMAADSEVAARITGLVEGARLQSVTAAAYTLDMAMAEADLGLRLAIQMGQSGTIAQVVKLKSQLAGHLAEKKGDIPAAALDEADVTMIQEIRAALVAKAKANAQAAEMMGESSTDVLVSDSDRPVMRLPPPKG